MNEENVIIFRSYLRYLLIYELFYSLIHSEGMWLTVLMLCSRLSSTFFVVCMGVLAQNVANNDGNRSQALSAIKPRGPPISPTGSSNRPIASQSKVAKVDDRRV